MTIDDLLEQEGKILSRFWGPTAEGGKELWWLFRDWCWMLEILPDNTGVWGTFKYDSREVPTCAGEIPRDQMVAMAKYILENEERLTGGG